VQTEGNSGKRIPNSVSMTDASLSAVMADSILLCLPRLNSSSAEHLKIQECEGLCAGSACAEELYRFLLVS